jgi:hypothetical protein
MNFTRPGIFFLTLCFSPIAFAAGQPTKPTIPKENRVALNTSQPPPTLTPPQISAEKTSPYRVLPTLYSSVEMRHTLARAQNDDQVVKSVPNLSLRPNIGMKYFENRLDSSFTFIFRRNPKELPISRDILYNETFIKVLNGQNGFISPYAYSEFDRENMDYKFSKVGLNFTGEKAIQGKWAILKLKGYVEPKVLVISDKYAMSKDFAVTPRNETSQSSLALNSSGATTMERRHVTYLDDFGASFKLSPANWSQLYTGLSVDVTSRWTPRYVARDTAGGVDTSFNGYERRSLTLSRWSMSYKFTDRLTLTNQLGHYDGGLYEYEIDARFADPRHEINSARWENRMSLSATLL